jgi:hypothetical protein
VLVYSDSRWETSLSTLAGRLSYGVAGAAEAEGVQRLDALRALLVAAGELEQAVEDAAAGEASGGAPALRARVVELTDAAAEAVVAEWMEGSREKVQSGLRAFMRALGMVESAAECSLEVKEPEGFAFYGLYPEQYVAATQRWMREQGSAEEYVLVIGIRSIGTTLAAVVAATLRHAGWSVRRATVRPSGHPFARTLQLGASAVTGVGWALVVDEGPGLSGSSMAAVAAALVRAGLGRERIAFFPGHGGDPGRAASEEVRAWWRSVPRYCVAASELRWRGRSLVEMLAEATLRVRDAGVSVIGTADVGAGAWRELAYERVDDWPAACTPFERAKYRVVLSDGSSVLWKFVGLTGAAEVAVARLERMHRAGWAPPMLAQALGYVAAPWIEGARCTSECTRECTPETIGAYIAGAAGEVMDAAEQRRALARLARVLETNSLEALGSSFGKAAARLVQAASLALPGIAVASAGDGRMGPWEWVRRDGGGLMKCDAEGHDVDHTGVGRQGIEWDLAGAAVEWRMDEAARLAMRGAVAHAGLDLAPPVLADLHEAAYCALRVGKCELCATMSSVADAERALALSAASYRSALARVLERWR